MYEKGFASSLENLNALNRNIIAGGDLGYMQYPEIICRMFFLDVGVTLYGFLECNDVYLAETEETETTK